ncbi:Multidrug resistance efflux pump [Antarctobacter heliothermus]|uniref:Multidrug resistance efflux pump n=2 Tax=Antarctobacter heliothermus TaxID=74033 RepID=A0A239JMY4_9RHOB|nr:Multidrug resistance efflux pump [Antarctobacter heliothermus]
MVGGVTCAVLIAAGGQIYHAYLNADLAATKLRTPREQVFSVAVATLTPATVTPIITAYGRLSSGRSLEVRSSVPGVLVGLSENFRNGGSVSVGEVLFQIDPARLKTALALAETDLLEVNAAQAEAKAALELAKLEAEASSKQLDLRDQALSRQQGLRDRGVATDTIVEAAVLARAAAEQTLISRQQSVAGAEARVAQAAIAIARREIALTEARRMLTEATVAAPFAGRVMDADAALGRLVSTNEKLAEIIDPTDIEVAFRVTNTQYSRLLNDKNGLRKTEVTLVSQSGKAVHEITAKVDRVDGNVGDDQVGRLVYARLVDLDTTLVLPGDFVTVKIPERPLSEVARIPATAATADGRILLIAEDNRLEEFQAKLLRQQGNDLIVSGVPFGRQYVITRALQLGPGIRVQPVLPTADGDTVVAAPAAPTTIALDDIRRAALIAFVEGNETMKPDSKARVLTELNEPEVPIATVEKFEAKMAEQ